MKKSLKALIAAAILPLGLFACEEDSPERKACLTALEEQQASGMAKGAHIPELEGLIGKDALSITKVDGFADFRILTPSGVVTMDYREDRINLAVDCDNIIIATSAG